MIRVVLPAHLDARARRPRGEARRRGKVTQRSVLDALEAGYPALRGTIATRSRTSAARFVRFFACEQDLSQESPDDPLPEAVARGVEPFLIVGAMAGG